MDTLDPVVREAQETRFPILKFFRWEHLPAHLQDVSAALGATAFALAQELPQNAETSAGLRKLLEAKDCFVRAAL